MDGLSWSSPRAPESFKRPGPSSDTLTRLASFIARAESKQGVKNHKPTALSLPCQECGPTSALSLPCQECGPTSALSLPCQECGPKSALSLPCQECGPTSALSLPCQECGEGFPFTSELLQHQEQALPKPHRCPGCGREFSLRSSLQLHQCESESETHVFVSDPPVSDGAQCGHVSDSSYTCAPCGSGFLQKQALLHHQQADCGQTEPHNHSSPEVDSPSASEEDASSSHSMDFSGASGSDLNVCSLCSRTFRTEAALQRHKLSSHLDEEQTFTTMFNDDKTTDDMKRGMNSRTKIKLFSCRSCDMVFRSTTQLYLHRKEKHTREIKTPTETRPAPRPVTSHRRSSTYTCQICSKVFFHHLSLWAHSKKHPASDFTALKNKSFPSRGSTKDGRLSEKPNPDRKCVLNKPRARNRVWQKTCPGENPGESGEVPEPEEDQEFPCPSCPEVFSLHSELKNHVELHQSAIRRCRCSVCTNEMDSCKWPGSKRHRLYHCVPCQQGFSSLEAFLTHCQDHLRVRVEEDGLTTGPS